MLYFKFIVSLIVLVNNGFSNRFTIKKIYDDKIFYNFVSYESDLYVSSNKGIYKITASGDDITLHDASIVGPINSIFQKNNNYKVYLFKKFNYSINKKIFKVKKQSFKKLKDPNLQSLEMSITDKIGLNVLIKNQKNNKGSITFEYKDIDQLNKIIEIIN